MINGKKDARFIADGIISVIEDIGAEKVLAVVTDGASNMQAATDMLSTKFPWISKSHCLLHVVNLLINDIMKEVQWFSDLESEVNEIINLFTQHQGAHAQVRCRT